MTDCCHTQRAAERVANVCPRGGSRGKAVEIQTVKALLTEQALGRFNRASHWFCPDDACEVVYFDSNGTTYTKKDVRVPVWQKEPFGARLICYCFGENERDIHAEVEELGRSDAVERVRSHIAAGRCACEVRNPRGACCLGELAAAVKRVTATVYPAASEAARKRAGVFHEHLIRTHDAPDR